MTEAARPPDLPRLVEQIRALFNEGELRDLCVDLGLDYENLSGAGKGDKARELVLLMQRLNRLPDLLARVTALRPHLGVNLQDLADELRAVAPQRGAELAGLAAQFKDYNKKLGEWKELHRQMNVLLTVFDPFRKQIERFDARPERFDLYALDANWQTVNLFIGPPYRDAGGELTGVEWGVRLGTIGAAIRRHLAARPAQPTANPDDVWWRRLREETSNLEDAIKQVLILADEELRKAAADLYDLSAETLWRSA